MQCHGPNHVERVEQESLTEDRGANACVCAHASHHHIYVHVLRPRGLSTLTYTQVSGFAGFYVMCSMAAVLSTSMFVGAPSKPIFTKVSPM